MSEPNGGEDVQARPQPEAAVQEGSSQRHGPTVSETAGHSGAPEVTGHSRWRFPFFPGYRLVPSSSPPASAEPVVSSGDGTTGDSQRPPPPEIGENTAGPPPSRFVFVSLGPLPPSLSNGQPPQPSPPVPPDPFRLVTQPSGRDGFRFLDLEESPAENSRHTPAFFSCLLLLLAVLMLLSLHPIDEPVPTRTTRHDVDTDKGFPDGVVESGRASSSSIDHHDGPPANQYSNKHSDVDDSLPDEDDQRNWGVTYQSTYRFPPSSFTLKGHYSIFLLRLPDASQSMNSLSDQTNESQIKTVPNTRSPNIEDKLSSSDRKHLSGSLNGSRNHSHWIPIDRGKLHGVLLTKPSVVMSVRLATIRFRLESELLEGPKQTIDLSGLDLRDVSTLTFQGMAPRSSLHLPAKNQVEEDVCRLVGSLRFDRFPAISLSARSSDVVQAGGGPSAWGFDEGEFADGGEWDRRLLGGVQRKLFGGPRRLLTETLTPTEEPGSGSTASSADQITTPHAPSIWKPFGFHQVNMEKRVNMSDQITNTFQDMEGVIISPDCSVKVLVAADEVDLVSLANRVIHFAFIFVVKGLLEIRYFLSQVRYTESGGSSIQKVCYWSLGLHTCVDCFESIILLTEGITSSFMASTFIVLAVFKLMFVSVVELRYLVLVLKARLGEASLTENLSRLVKLHAFGTAIMLVGTLKLLPVFPPTISLMYCFWVPQIFLDAWKGYKRSLSPQYILGISLCRLFFPTYLWGCPASIFDGEILRSPPGAPSSSLASSLVLLVGFQVMLLFIQRTLGPRAFIPVSWLPDYYNYYRRIKPDDTESRVNLECVICMTEIDRNSKLLVTTPCDHHFHDKCLHQWIDVKSECPTCRGPLPPFP